MIKYVSIFWLVLGCLLVARKDNLTGFSTGLTGRSKNLDPTGFHLCSVLVDRYGVRLRIGRSEVQISGRSNWSQCCQRLATAATFLGKELCCPGSMIRRWGPANSLHAPTYYSEYNKRIELYTKQRWSP